IRPAGSGQPGSQFGLLSAWLGGCRSSAIHPHHPLLSPSSRSGGPASDRCCWEGLAVSIHVPFVGRLKLTPLYAVRSGERVLFRSERMALTLLRKGHPR